jgi:hypothetical protein
MPVLWGFGLSKKAQLLAAGHFVLAMRRNYGVTDSIEWLP